METGMYNYGYRDYKAEAGRFTLEDPVKDGNNWYAYVNNDPVNWVDLWGLAGFTVRDVLTAITNLIGTIFVLDNKFGRSIGAANSHLSDNRVVQKPQFLNKSA